MLFPLPLINQLADAGGAVTIDAYGNVYGTFFGAVAPGLGTGVSIGEGYINNNPSQHLSVMAQNK